MHKSAKIYIAGHKGLVGSAIMKVLLNQGYSNLVVRTHEELDLTDQYAVDRFMRDESPEYIILAAARVGGIMANNTQRGDFIYSHILIQATVINAARKYGGRKLLFLGSTCIYPRESPQPMSENHLLSSELEYTNEPYAIAKIAGIKMCESYNIQYGTNFLCVMPTNLYGPNDNFDLYTSHVLPAILRKIHLAKNLSENNIEALRKDIARRPLNGLDGQAPIDELRKELGKCGITGDEVVLWGTGNPMREFLWSEEMGEACVFVMNNVDFADLSKGRSEIRNLHINIGTGREISIRDLTELVKQRVGYDGRISFDARYPDGTPRKLTDVSRIHSLGWRHKVEVDEGVARLYEWYKNSLHIL
ncbi:MAG: GDP-L-fucose synthase [Tannerellaceae bacterium]|jgi:GDP-L-fucose synthase|nr:GDP-L-fucose synthase [Tannerellaceae bacterium]